jgi:hypothetical protein
MAMSFEHLVNKVMTDAKFRTRLKADPNKALKAVGVKATPGLVKSLKAMDWASVHKVNAHYKTAQGVSC